MQLLDAGYRWYLQRIQAAVDKACRESNRDQVDLIGHSAGGWLARAFVGDALYMKSNLMPESSLADHLTVAPGLGLGTFPRSAHQRVRRLVTLGTPHLGPSSGRDMTGGTLTWLNAQWPGIWQYPTGITHKAWLLLHSMTWCIHCVTDSPKAAFAHLHSSSKCMCCSPCLGPVDIPGSQFGCV